MIPTVSQIARSFVVAAAGALIFAGLLYIMERPPESLWSSALGFGLGTLVISLVKPAFQGAHVGRAIQGRKSRRRSTLISVTAMAALGAVLLVGAGLASGPTSDVSANAWAGVILLGAMIGGTIGGLFTVAMNTAKRRSSHDLRSPSS